MKKVLKKAAILLAILFLAIQTVRPEKKNAPVAPEKSIHAQMDVPPNVSKILDRACRDCHTNQTRWPWYADVAPVSWWVIDHSTHGREHLNFSAWDEYDRVQAQQLLIDICKLTSAGEMPLKSYLLMHRDAQLSKDDVRALCEWSETQQAKLAKKPQAGISNR